MIRFALIGILCTGLQYLVMAILVIVANWNEVLASGLGYLLSSMFSYFLNYRFSFKPDRSVAEGSWRYALVAALGLAANSICLSGLLSFGLPVMPAQIMTTGIVFVSNYLLSRYWAFNKPGNSRPASVAAHPR